MKLRIALAFTALALAAGSAYAKDLTTTEIADLFKAGTILSQDKLDAAALAEYPGGTIEEGEIEKHRRGYVYEVEVIAANGDEWDLDIDATNGKVLKKDQD
jgi:uncharacterized membrane protein YkoI